MALSGVFVQVERAREVLKFVNGVSDGSVSPMGQMMSYLMRSRRNVAVPPLAHLFCVDDRTIQRYYSCGFNELDTNEFIKSKLERHLWTYERLLKCHPAVAEQLCPGVLLQNDGNYCPSQANGKYFFKF